MIQRKLNWWYRLFHEGAHMAFRVLSLVFSAASAMAIYWFFSALGDDRLRHLMTVGVAVGFAVLGYFVMRGLAFRLLSKRRVLKLWWTVEEWVAWWVGPSCSASVRRSRHDGPRGLPLTLIRVTHTSYQSGAVERKVLAC